MKVFEDYSYYYNAFYKDKDYKKEADDVDSILKKYGKDVSSVILFGCGTGCHDRALSRLGYKCHGIDLSSRMIDAAVQSAQTEGLDITYENADIRTYTSAAKYDAVLSLFHVMSYQIGNEDILSAFRAARECLEKGGIFVFDVWYGPGVLTDKPAIRIKKAEDENNLLVRYARPEMFEDRNVVDVNYEVFVIDKKTSVAKVINETHSMRYFFAPEIRQYLHETGFGMISHFDCATLGKTDTGSWTAYFVAEAI